MRLKHILVALAALTAIGARAAPVPIVAAESTYGAIAEAIGGPYVSVTSILRNPAADPHDFEASPQTARALASASIVIVNGLGYDAWADRLVAAHPSGARRVVVAAELARGRVMADANPHLFYDTRVADAVAARIAALLTTTDPAHAAAFEANLRQFRAGLDAVDARVAQLGQQRPGLRVAATEPVYGYMLRALGWPSSGQSLQFAVMNDTDPAPAVVARFEDDLRAHRVALLFYNRQVSSPLTRRLQDVARSSGVATVGVDEFLAPGTRYDTWLLRGLDETAAALARRRP